MSFGEYKKNHFAHFLKDFCRTFFMAAIFFLHVSVQDKKNVIEVLTLFSLMMPFGLSNAGTTYWRIIYINIFYLFLEPLLEEVITMVERNISS